MSPNRRIFLNVIATYGRSLYAMLLGLFTSRWILESLGVVDYGLVGVVGGLTGMVSFFNGLLAEAIVRFYAYSVGKEKVNDGNNALEECREWFSIALVIHIFFPIVLVVIGYPIGLWMVKNWLVIPPERIDECIWVWRISCVSCFFGMVNVPFHAMYAAKQEIAELTVYSLVSTTINALFILFMVNHPSDWLVRYCLISTVIAISPMLIINVRAVIKYPECRFRARALKNLKKIQSLLIYSGARFWGAISQLVTSQGIALIVNKLLGPARNAAMSVGGNLTSKTMILKTSFCNALQPAIVNAAGENDYDKVRSLAYRACTYAALSIAFFALPLILEIDEVMRFWLKNPPELSGRLCQLWLIACFIDHSTIGHVYAIFAKGKIVVFQVGEGLIWISALIVAYLGIVAGLDICAVGIGWIVMFFFNNILKIYCAKKEVVMSIRHWICRIVLPSIFVCILTLIIGWIPHLFMEQNFLRLVITTIVSEIVFLPLVWFFFIELNERRKIISYLKGIFAKRFP